MFIDLSRPGGAQIDEAEGAHRALLRLAEAHFDRSITHLVLGAQARAQVRLCAPMLAPGAVVEWALGDLAPLLEELQIGALYMGAGKWFVLDNPLYLPVAGD